MNYHCEKCNKDMDEKQFYTYKDGRKTEFCKKCLTMHIDNFNPDTFLWLLQKMDVPYIPEEWNVLRDRAFAKNPNLNGMSVFGKYISKMKLKQFKDFSWEDNEKIQALNEAKAAARTQEEIDADNAYREELKKQFECGEISEAQYKTLASTVDQKETYESAPVSPVVPPSAFNPFDPMGEDETTGPAAELTQEDKLYLSMKWGKAYRASEWIELERTYTEMINSFDIQDADTTNTLILICKTNLKMNQAIDQGDMDGFQKLSRVYESLRKSAKFTAAQNKEEKEDFVDCVGELVAMCEKDGFIPRFATDIPQDKVDFTIKDMKDYLYTLVTKDLGFGQQIENALKSIQIQKEMQEAEEDGDTILEDEDFDAFYEEIERQRELDNQIGLEDEEEE